MKLYTIHTPSHKPLYDNFLKSLPTEFEHINKEIPQECETGDYYEKGWDITCYRKVEFFYEKCKENQGEYIVFSDVDIQFFTEKLEETLLKEIGDYDIACQDDCGIYCSGFFIVNCNEATLQLFKTMKEKYVKEDQTSLNAHIGLVKAKFLSRKFFTVGHIIRRQWVGQDFSIPYEILIHHSNWTIGIDNKMKLMEVVKNKLNK